MALTVLTILILMNLVYRPSCSAGESNQHDKVKSVKGNMK